MSGFVTMYVNVHEYWNWQKLKCNRYCVWSISWQNSYKLIYKACILKLVPCILLDRSIRVFWKLDQLFKLFACLSWVHSLRRLSMYKHVYLGICMYKKVCDSIRNWTLEYLRITKAKLLKACDSNSTVELCAGKVMCIHIDCRAFST